MIHYALRCPSGHAFDGWFKDSASFEHQAHAGLLTCPECADTRVERALMAPAVRTARAKPKLEPAEKPADTSPAQSAPATRPAPAKPPPEALAAALPDQLRAALQRLRAEVEQKCEYVGTRFADAARGIATGEETPRPIYGEATPEEEAQLADEGIEVSRIPWVPRANG